MDAFLSNSSFLSLTGHKNELVAYMVISMATGCFKCITDLGLLWRAWKGEFCATENMKAHIQIHNETKIHSPLSKHDTSIEVKNLRLNDATGMSKQTLSVLKTYLVSMMK